MPQLFHRIAFLLEEHSYITDASTRTFKNELFNDLVPFEKSIQN